MQRRYLSALVPFALFCAALVALHRLGGEFHLRDILAEFAAIEHWRILAAIALAAGSYLVLTGYERLALGYVGRTLPWSKYALTSFVSYAVGHNVGVAALSGGATRYRIYTPLGFGAAEIARIVAFCTITFALGATTLAGVSLIANAGEASSLLHSTTQLSVTLGVLALCTVAAYLLACTLRRAPFEWRGVSVQLPTLGTALCQLRACRGGPRPRKRGALRAAAGVGGRLLPCLRRPLHGRAGGKPAEPGAGRTRCIRIDRGPAAARECLRRRCSARCSPIGSSTMRCRSALPLLLLSAHEFRQQRARLAEVMDVDTVDRLISSCRRRSPCWSSARDFCCCCPARRPVPSQQACRTRPIPAAAGSRIVPPRRVGGRRAAADPRATGCMRRLDGAWQVTMSLLGAGIARLAAEGPRLRGSAAAWRLPCCRCGGHESSSTGSHRCSRSPCRQHGWRVPASRSARPSGSARSRIARCPRPERAVVAVRL